jgi:hypothetical protein
VASIYHDVGFPAEKLEVLFSDFFRTTVGRELRSQVDWSSVVLANNNIRHIDVLSRLFGERNMDLVDGGDRFERWFHKRLFEDHDHGVLTSLMVLNQGWKTEAEWELAYEAALAIALHSYRHDSADTPGSNEDERFDVDQLPVEDFPLAFFLSYCDVAQEWGRKVLLERIKRVSTSKDSHSVRFFRAINSRLMEPVPRLTLDRDREDSARRLKTTVAIRYPLEQTATIADDQTLKQVFTGIADGFEATWYLRNQKEKDFWIQGEDRNGIPIGYIHPAPTISSTGRNQAPCREGRRASAWEVVLP